MESWGSILERGFRRLPNIGIRISEKHVEEGGVICRPLLGSCAGRSSGCGAEGGRGNRQAHALQTHGGSVALPQHETATWACHNDMVAQRRPATKMTPLNTYDVICRCRYRTMSGRWSGATARFQPLAKGIMILSRTLNGYAIHLAVV